MKATKGWNQLLTKSLASFPGPAQLSITCSTEKQERAWYLFSREWRQGRKELCVGTLGPEQRKEPRHQVTYHMYLASRRRWSYLHTLSIKCVVNYKTWPVSCANFLITSCSREKRYQTLLIFPYCKQWKAGRGLGTRLPYPIITSLRSPEIDTYF